MLEEDEQALRELAKSCRDAKEKMRYLALHALSIGQPVALVAKIFCVDESAIYRWVDQWQKEKNLADKPRTGRPPILDEKKKEEIKRLVAEKDPKEYGINASFWDTKELQLYFKMKGIDISREAIRSALKEMGARYVKAQLVYPEADEKLRREFAKQFLKDLASKKNSVVILFQDEMAAYCSPRKGYGWTFEKRLDVVAPQRGGRKRLNCFGAVNPLKGEVIQMSSKESKAPALTKFLGKVNDKYLKKQIWIYMDNLPVHKSDLVKEFLEEHPNIEVRFLPPYSPDINIQEQWWNHQRKKLLNNRCFGSTHQLAINISQFGRQTPPEEVMSICNFSQIENLLR